MKLPPSDIQPLLLAIQTGNIIIGSDGSIRDFSGSYSARIQSTTSQAIHASLHSTCRKTSTIRAESFGHLAALYLLRALFLFYNIPTTPSRLNIKSYIDNQGLIQRLAHGPDRTIHYITKTNSDLIREIQSTEASIPFDIERIHVKSHQYDKEDDYNKIPPPSRINKQCDISAEEAYNCQTCNKSKTCPPFPTTTAYILRNGQRIESNFMTALRSAPTDIDTRNYILSKQEHWTDEDFDSIEWDFLHDAILHTSPSSRKAFIKLSHKLWATNEVLAKRSKRRHDSRGCSRCQSPKEHFAHVFQCNSTDSQQSRQQALLTYRSFLRTSNFSAPMISGIIEGLTAWMSSTSYDPPIDYHHNDTIAPLLLEAYYHQQHLGWDQFLRGRISNRWAALHHAYCNLNPGHSLNTTPSPNYGGPSLVRATFALSLTIWQSRNNAQHGADLTETQNRQIARLDNKIRSAYQHPEYITDTNDSRILFRILVEDRLQQSPSTKLHWYLLYESCLHAPPDPLADDEPMPQQPTSLHEFFRTFPSHFSSQTSNANVP